MSPRERPRDRLLDRPRDRQRPPRAQYDLHRRLLLLSALLGFGAFGLVARAAYMQLVDQAFYRQQGDARFVREVSIPTSRGMITDRNGEPLAISTPVASLWANPRELLKAPDRLPELARALGVPADALTRRLTQRADREFVYLKRRMDPDAAQRVLALDIPGVFSQREYRRFYPQGEVMAQLLGFTNVDDHGQEGLELAFDDWLSGTPGLKKVIRDRRGRIVENVDLIRAAQPGHDLALSIDQRIQYLTYRELKQQVLETGASSGSAVVLDIATGEVLAMANVPSFNPNAVDSGDRDAHRNRAVTDLFEPGSTMKPLTVAAALEAGVITPRTLFNTSPGWIPNGQYRTTDTHDYGTLDTTGVITKSSNVGASLIAQRLTSQQLYGFARRFGYGQSTHSGFPGEASGLLPSPDRWSGTTKQTMSYGYGLSVTLLQVAHAYAALANHGVMHAPTFMKGQATPTTQVLTPPLAHEIIKMMQTVTEPGGTATRAAILGYHVAGKTGTARVASDGGYLRRYVSFFAGVVPVDNPRFAMAVVINEPDTSKGWSFGGGGYVSAPVFHNVMDGALRLMDVPPDDIPGWLAGQAKAKSHVAAMAPGAVETSTAAPLAPQAGGR
jgi:cell division protein FtsI (penicillin-binding protein 3)